MVPRVARGTKMTAGHTSLSQGPAEILGQRSAQVAFLQPHGRGHVPLRTGEVEGLWSTEHRVPPTPLGQKAGQRLITPPSNLGESQLM